MLLIIEIALTIAAWRKGWGAKALLPGVIGVLVVVFIGGLMAATSTEKGTMIAVSVVSDLALIAVLSWFARNAPKPKVVAGQSPLHADAGTVAAATSN